MKNRSKGRRPLDEQSRKGRRPLDEQSRKGRRPLDPGKGLILCNPF